jgi:hypothetical protein
MGDEVGAKRREKNQSQIKWPLQQSKRELYCAYMINIFAQIEIADLCYLTRQKSQVRFLNLLEPEFGI